ncbi:formate--tetrahydrofolate ligase [Devriesea agamarum]|uniref:formate--tetrahydrofolate ligase n=1 Tax=Devriesea agamarum TaxID=472569 RepID=UPI00071D1798|nr:formate--tetrahydrofolate ligase [Devriesea agamarum]
MSENTNPDLAIAQKAVAKPLTDIAARAGIPAEALIPYGRHAAKIEVEHIPQADDKSPGRLILVSAISPTPAGEGKSTVTVGLADAFTLLGHRTMVALREPSLGPVMGVKGGATGGGYAQVIPMEEINLHFTGDLHAITCAHNTLSALIDNHIQQGNELEIDPRRLQWKRVLDINDRALRNVVVGLGGPVQGVPREDGFDITVASEIMAVLCLATDLQDLRHRLGEMLIGYRYDRSPVQVKDLKVEGALTLLLKNAIHPNLVQTLGGTPALVHGGPFANIAHGCNSLRATSLARRLSDIVITEAGFGSDLGAEKFFDIKGRTAGFLPDAVVLVATVRALKRHGGQALADLNTEDLEALRAGTVNLARHVKNIRRFGVEPVVAVNRFGSDTQAELDALLGWCRDHGVRAALTEVWAFGGEGGKELAHTVLAAMDSPVGAEKPDVDVTSGRAAETARTLYDPEDGIDASLRTIATEIYGADDVRFTDRAPARLKVLAANGWDKLPVCVAKTQYSFSDDATALGAPTGHTLHVRDLIPKLGAGFVVALTGSVMTMPGLPKSPAALKMDVDENGQAVGLF